MHLQHTVLSVAANPLTAVSAAHFPTNQGNPEILARQSGDSSTGAVTFNGCLYNVAGTGKFKNKVVYTFAGSSLPAGLRASGYFINDTAKGAPWNHQFQAQNVYVSGGFLNLKVPGGQDPSANANNAIGSAEVVTDEKTIQYASVRTKGIFSSVAGTCASSFFYKSDNNEIDIEYLSDPKSLSNTGSLPNPVWFGNQKATSSSPTTASGIPGPSNATSAINEYRIDWNSGSTKYYFNGNLLKTYTQNVPQVGGAWVWNNWSNGGKGWTLGPPASDNIFRIQTIEMYYNLTDSVGCGQAP